MKKIIILFLVLALFGCKDDEVTTPKTAALTINLDELFDRPWYIVEERDFITSEFQFDLDLQFNILRDYFEIH
jgi:hypothetical protein